MEVTMRKVNVGITVIVLVFCSFVAGAAQSKLRRIEQPERFVYKNTPIEIRFFVDDKQLVNGQIYEGSDWLRRLRLEVANISPKNISSFRVDLMLREPKSASQGSQAENSGIVITYDLRYANPPTKVLQANTSVVLMPPVGMIDYWTEYAREQGLTDIDRVSFEIRQVTFTDDTGWMLGSPTKRDPQTGRMLFVKDELSPSPLLLSSNLMVQPFKSSFFCV